jgi:hypothetical protein
VNKMNSYAKPLLLIMVGTLFAGLMAFVQVQSSSAQTSGLTGLDKIPGASLVENFLGNGNINPSSTIPDYLDIDKAVIASDPKSIQAVLQAHGHIPKDGSGGAFGYGIITKYGKFDAVIVSTTHKGVLDSVKQNGDPNNPVWHNHYVSLGKNDFCDTAVLAITYQSPGNVVINKNKAVMSNLPNTFKGTDALTGDKLTLTPGTNVDRVVSFKLDPQFNENTHELEAVCVTDVRDADKIIK